jgi:DNA-binding transcriptional LysR family regulator
MRLKSTLEQWATLQEIDKAGSIQAAALTLNKSHTTLIYSIKKLEQQLSVNLVEVKGRRAVLTDDGKSLLRRASSMLEQARDLEILSQQVSAGVESEILIAMDHLCDPSLLFNPMAHYLKQNRFTSIQLVETSLSKTTEMVTSERADIAIINLPITNYPAEVFSLTSMVPVVSKEHPLAMKSIIAMSDFATHCQVVVRDLGASTQHDNQLDVGWLKSNQRVTVDNFDHAFRAVEQGVGFCRLPEHIIAKRDRGQLKVLRIEENNKYQIPLHITLPKGPNTGPAARCFYQFLLKQTTALGS